MHTTLFKCSVNGAYIKVDDALIKNTVVTGGFDNMHEIIIYTKLLVHVEQVNPFFSFCIICLISSVAT